MVRLLCWARHTEFMPEHTIHLIEVEKVIDTLRPALHMDGGDVELVDVDDEGFIYLKMQGACVGCPMSQATLVLGIENELRAQLGDQVAGVISV